MSTLFPATPGGASPGAARPGDPGATGGGGGGGGSPVLNQWSATTTNDPGLLQASIANQDGSTLVAFIGWNSETFPPATGNARVSVADNAHNYWQPIGGGSSSFFFGVRGAIWIATGADPATLVSISSASPVSSMCALIIEMPGMPSLVGTDFAPAIGYATSNSFSQSVTATAPDWAFGLLASGNNLDTVTGPGAPWTALNTVSVNDPLDGAGGLADLAITPVYAQVGAGGLSLTYSTSGTLPGAIVLSGITQASPVVTNTGNPNFPLFTVQAAFGALVGSNAATWTWTDITSRAVFGDGENILDVTRGRAYELTSPEAGTIKLWLNNQDGALTPGNPTSPYYPNILPETPIRVLATWANEVYAVAWGYMDQWPQSFPDSPQWGFTNASASDAMGVLANVTLHSAYQSEVLLDNPYSYWPFSESYGTANGLPFENLGSGNTNTKPMIGLDAQNLHSMPLSTGLTLNMRGDTGEGIGLSGITTNPANWSSGARCTDPALFNVLGGGAVSVEFWASLPTSPPGGGSFVTPLVSLLGAPTNFGSGGGPVRFQAAAKSMILPGYAMQVTMANFSGSSFTTTAFSLPNDGNLHHHVFNVSGTTVTHYLDGALDATVTSSVGFTSDITDVVVGPAVVSPIPVNPYNYTIAHVAVYGLLLPDIRILMHFQIGINGASNESAIVRFKRIMAWSQSYLAMAATLPSAAPIMGAAFTLQGQAVTDAFNDILVTEGGWPYADAAGNVWYAARTSFYNKSPKWVFGDNPAGGEIPYDPSQTFGFDNAYLYTVVQALREVSTTTDITTSPTEGVNAQQFLNTGAQIQVASAAAKSAYGNRNSLQQSVIAYTDQDVYDRAFWSLQKYSSSSFRIPQITIDAASNPSLWPVVLGVEQGDIVKANRRPLGGAPYAVMGIIVQVHLEIGVNKGKATLGIVPYNIESNVIHVDDPAYGTLANGIGW